MWSPLGPRCTISVSQPASRKPSVSVATPDKLVGSPWHQDFQSCPIPLTGLPDPAPSVANRTFTRTARRPTTASRRMTTCDSVRVRSESPCWLRGPAMFRLQTSRPRSNSVFGCDSSELGDSIPQRDPRALAYCNSKVLSERRTVASAVSGVHGDPWHANTRPTEP